MKLEVALPHSREFLLGPYLKPHKRTHVSVYLSGINILTLVILNIASYVPFEVSC